MTYSELYMQKAGTLRDALNLIRSNDGICLAGDCNIPVEFAYNLHTIAPRVNNVSVINCRIGDFPFVKNPGMNGHINTGGFFFGVGWSKGHQNLNASLIITDLSDYWRTKKLSEGVAYWFLCGRRSCPL